MSFLYFIFMPTGFFMNFILEKFDASIKLKSGSFFTLSSFELVRFIAFLSLFIAGNISYFLYEILLIVSLVIFVYNCKYYYRKLNSFSNFDLESYDICSNSYLVIIVINAVIFLLMSIAFLNTIIFTLFLLSILIQYIYISIRCIYIRYKVIKYIDFVIMNKGV